MSRLSRSRRLWFGAVFALMILGGLELALRLAGFSLPNSVSFMEFNYPTHHLIRDIFVPDPVLLWHMRPGTKLGDGLRPLNRQGFRGPDFTAEKTPGVPRVACVGDSVTFGGGVTYPDLLAETLRERTGKPVQVYSFGVPNYSSLQGARLLPEVLATYHPDVVVILFGWNDHWRADGPPDRDKRVGSHDRARLEPLRRLRLYQLLAQLIRMAASRGPRPATEPLRVPPEQYEANLKAMVEQCRNAGARPILLTAPSAISTGAMPEYLTMFRYVPSRAELVRLHALYNDLTRQSAQGLHVKLIDLDLIFQRADVKSLYDDPNRDLIHPNARGYQLIAESVADGIIKLRTDGN